MDMLVNDLLLKELSAETRKIGSKIMVKRVPGCPAYPAEISDIIIIPHSEFYRSKFMVFYQANQYNAVKTLKELHRNFPFTPDYNLGIGYVLNRESVLGGHDPTGCIKLKGEIEIPEIQKSQLGDTLETWKKPESGFL